MRRFLVGAAFAGVLALPAPVTASCVAPPPNGRAVKEADIVFIGTVTATTNNDRWATVEVEEIWKGDDIDPIVEIKAGPADPPGPAGVASSADRTFEEGVRYLFFPYRGKKGFTDSSCSNTTRFTPELERFRPTSARDLGGATGDADGGAEASSFPLVIGAAILVAALVFARRRITN